MGNVVFIVVGEQTPSVAIDNKKLSVVTCSYYYETATDKSLGQTNMTVSDYYEGEPKLRHFLIDFKTKVASEYYKM